MERVYIDGLGRVANSGGGLRINNLSGRKVEKKKTSVPKHFDFVPAKTVKEAEEYAKRFVDDKTFAAKGVDYNGIGLDSANAVNEALTELFDDYDVGKLGGVIAPKGNTKLGQMIANAKAAYSPVLKSLMLNNRTFKSLKTLAQSIEEEKRLVLDYLKNPSNYVFKTKKAETVMKASILSGRATVPETVRDIINHEFGHTFEKAISKMANFDVIKDNMQKFASKISGYATLDIGEYIAESFASFRKGEGLIDPELEKAFLALEKKSLKNSLTAEGNLTKSIAKLGNTGIIISDKQFGKKVGKHAIDWGLDPSKEEDRASLFGIISDIVQNHDEKFTGSWSGQEDNVNFWLKGEDIVITTKDNKFVTIMKGGVNNARVKKARIGEV